MSSTQVITHTGVDADPGAPAPGGAPNGAPTVPGQPDPQNVQDYTSRPNAPPRIAESVPSAQWARWRLYRQRPDIQDKFPKSFPDVSKHLHDRLTAQIRDAARHVPDPPRFTERSIDEVKGSGDDKYQPTQLGFAPLTQFYDEADHQNSRLSPRQRLDSDEDGDRIPSLWFERMSQDLFARVWDFCSETFGAENVQEDDLIKKLNSQDWTVDWLAKLPHEFVVLASQVARGDMTIVEAPKANDPNNWEFLFLDKVSRVKLVVGVMAKLLEKNVFNSLLVGATETQRDALMADDKARAFLDNSYQRNRTRSETVRNYIQSNRATLGIGLTDLFTDYFWNEVEGVTMGILDLLLPLINLLGRDMPDSPWPPLRQVHQRLHDIVAEAAYFTNGMRATRSVFWIQFPLPGELNDISHEHAIDDIWNRSKKRALDYDEAESAKWETTRDTELAQRYPGQAISPANRAEYEAEKPCPFVRRTAKVQIAMWPFVKRYTPMRERDAGDGAYNTGETITQIMKAQTVYYYGDDSDAADLKERLTLSEHIKSRRWAKWFTTKAIFCYVLVFVLIFLFTRPPPFPQDLGSNGDIRSLSHDQESVQRRKTATVEGAPVETTITAETVVVESIDEDRVSESQQRSKAPSVSRTTETITETFTRRLGGGQGGASGDTDDDQKDHVSDSSSDSSSNSYGEISGTHDDDSSTGTGDGIAASISSGVERVTETTTSGSNRLADNIASVANNVASGAKSAAASLASRADQAGSSIASAKNEAAASIMSGADKARSSIESVTEKVTESFTSGADRAGSSIESVTEKVADSFASGADQAGSSIESVTEKVADSFTSGADLAGASFASGVGSVSEDIASRAGGDDGTNRGDGAADAESDEDEAEESTLPEETREDRGDEGSEMRESRVSVEAKATKVLENKSRSRLGIRNATKGPRASVEAAEKSKAAESRKSRADRDRTIAERQPTRTSSSFEEHAATSVKSSTSSESKKRKKASEASEAGGNVEADEASKVSEASEISEAGKADEADEADEASEVSDIYKKSAATSVASRITPEEMNIETATVYKNEDGTISVLGVTTRRIATPSKKKMQTTTVTVPRDYVVEVVAGPPTSTAGSFTNIYQTVRLTSERWRFLQGCFQTWRSIWIALVVIGYWLTYHDRRYPHATIGSALLIIGVGMGVLHVEHMTHVQWQL